MGQRGRELAHAEAVEGHGHFLVAVLQVAADDHAIAELGVANFRAGGKGLRADGRKRRRLPRRGPRNVHLPAVVRAGVAVAACSDELTLAPPRLRRAAIRAVTRRPIVILLASEA